MEPIKPMPPETTQPTPITDAPGLPHDTPTLPSDIADDIEEELGSVLDQDGDGDFDADDVDALRKSLVVALNLKINTPGVPERLRPVTEKIEGMILGGVTRVLLGVVRRRGRKALARLVEILRSIGD